MQAHTNGKTPPRTIEELRSAIVTVAHEVSRPSRRIVPGSITLASEEVAKLYSGKYSPELLRRFYWMKRISNHSSLDEAERFLSIYDPMVKKATSRISRDKLAREAVERMAIDGHTPELVQAPTKESPSSETKETIEEQNFCNRYRIWCRNNPVVCSDTQAAFLGGVGRTLPSYARVKLIESGYTFTPSIDGWLIEYDPKKARIAEIKLQLSSLHDELAKLEGK